MASKYIFTIGRKHIFNPAAFSVALSALILGQSATWWIDGNLVLLPCALGGLLIVRKSADLISSFLFRRRAADYRSHFPAVRLPYSRTYSNTLHFFFLRFVMLTEPLTAPPSEL